MQEEKKVACIQRIETQLQDFFTEFLSGDVGRIDEQPSAGKWSAREHLAHLARYHQVFLTRIDQILAEENPQFLQYRAESDSEWPMWQSKPYSKIVEELFELRRQLVDRIRGLNEDLENRGTHPKFGPLTVIQWLEFFLVHEAHHLYGILKLIKG